MDRREFIKGAAALSAVSAAGGCASQLCGTSFYGPTIRDRLWMWGHHVDCAARAASLAKDKPKDFRWPGRVVDQAEGCRLMGIPNDCVVRWLDLPKYPWGNYFEQFRGLRRVAFSITQTATESIEDNMRIVFDELQPTLPNLTGCYLDDYFLAEDPDYVPDLKRLERIADGVHAHGLRLSVVAYADQRGLKPAFKPHFGFMDEVSYWFWKGDSIATMADRVRQCRDFIGSGKDLLLGLYMWDFSEGAPIPADKMAHQLECARTFLADRTVDGLIFHPSFAAALDAPAVNLAKRWIAEHGESRWGA